MPKDKISMGVTAVLEDTGRFIFGLVETAGRGTILFGKALRQVSIGKVYRNFDKIVQQIFICGVAAIPVVTLTSAFTGMIIAAQTGNELRKFGMASLAMGPIVGGSILREMGPMLTAICVAGFVGGGMASEIATMRVNEEIDALEVMSINPVRYLVMPRLIAMMIALPLLTVYADVVGVLGGAVVSYYQIGVSYQAFFDMGEWLLALRDVAFGLIKALVFGVIITVVACEQGYYASGGAEGVGRATMRSVVYSFLLILVSNFLLFSLIFLPIFSRIWN
jgi:phospholipid/cholesterol/gamma-HCH transport system permease protein